MSNDISVDKVAGQSAGQKVGIVGSAMLAFTMLFNQGAALQPAFAATPENVPENVAIATPQTLAQNQQRAQQLGRQIFELLINQDRFDMDMYIQTAQEKAAAKPVTYDPNKDSSTTEMLDKVLALVEQGADVNYKDSATGISIAVRILWHAMEAKEPKYFTNLFKYGLDPKQTTFTGTPLSYVARASLIEIMGPKPIPKNLITMIVGTQMPDPALLEPNAKPAKTSILLLEDHAIHALTYAQKTDTKSIKTAIAILKALHDNGLSFKDAGVALEPGTPVKTYADFVKHLPSLLIDEHIDQRALLMSMFVDAGLVDSSEMQSLVGVTPEEQAEMDTMPFVTKEFLEKNGAIVIENPDAVPGGGKPYLVREGDTLQNVAHRFSDAMGAKTEARALQMLADKNGLKTDSLLKVDAEILIPQPPEHMLDEVTIHSPGFLALVGISNRLKDKMNVTSAEEAGQKLAEINRLFIAQDQEGNSFLNLAPGSVLFYPDAQSNDELHPAIVAPEDTLYGFAAEAAPIIINPETGKQGATIEVALGLIAQMNNIDMDSYRTGKIVFVPGDRLYVSYHHDGINDMEKLELPETYDPNDPRSNITLLVVEGYGKQSKERKERKEEKENLHGKETSSVALRTLYALQPGKDFSGEVLRVDDQLFSIPGYDSTPALRKVLFNDRAIISFSMGIATPDPAANYMRDLNEPFGIRFQSMRRFMEMLGPIAADIVVAAGNFAQYTPPAENEELGPPAREFLQGWLMAQMATTRIVGAVTEDTRFTPEGTKAIALYSSPYADSCMKEPVNLNKNANGTSYTAPKFAALLKEYRALYPQLTSEEIEAVMDMVADRNIMDFDPAGQNIMYDKSGMRSVPDISVGNDAGVPIGTRCGFGYIDSITAKVQARAWLDRVVALKAEMGNPQEKMYERIIDLSTEVEERTLPGNKKEYEYRVKVPEDVGDSLTLLKLTFFVPQEQGAHSDSIKVISPGGFEQEMPKSIYDTTFTRNFSYADVKKGNVFRVITSEFPLVTGPGMAGIVLRGIQGGNVIQKLRDELRDEGVLLEPGQAIYGGEVMPDFQAFELLETRKAEAQRRIQQQKNFNNNAGQPRQGAPGGNQPPQLQP